VWPLFTGPHEPLLLRASGRSLAGGADPASFTRPKVGRRAAEFGDHCAPAMLSVSPGFFYSHQPRSQFSVLVLRGSLTNRKQRFRSGAVKVGYFGVPEWCGDVDRAARSSSSFPSGMFYIHGDLLLTAIKAPSLFEQAGSSINLAPSRPT